MATEDNAFGVQLATMLSAAPYETLAKWLPGTKIVSPGLEDTLDIEAVPETEQFIVKFNGTPLGNPFKFTEFSAEVKDAPLTVFFATDEPRTFYGQVVGPNTSLKQAFPQDVYKAHCEESKDWPVSCAAFAPNDFNSFELTVGIVFLAVGSVLAVFALVLGPLFNSVGFGVGFAVPAVLFLVFGALCYCQVF